MNRERVYLDTSFLVALMVDDPHSGRANSFLNQENRLLVVSDFGAAEFSAAIALHVRTRAMTRRKARIAFATVDAWIARTAERTSIGPGDVTAADAFVRRLDLNLRVPDALHIAIAQRIGATLATFDERIAANAAALGTPVAAA